MNKADPKQQQGNKRNKPHTKGRTTPNINSSNHSNDNNKSMTNGEDGTIAEDVEVVGQVQAHSVRLPVHIDVILDAKLSPSSATSIQAAVLSPDVVIHRSFPASFPSSISADNSILLFPSSDALPLEQGYIITFLF